MDSPAAVGAMVIGSAVGVSRLEGWRVQSQVVVFSHKGSRESCWQEVRSGAKEVLGAWFTNHERVGFGFLRLGLSRHATS